MGLEDIRNQIDRIDDELLARFLERMELSAQVAQDKARSGKHVYDKSRERQILKRVRAAAGDKERYADTLYNTIFALSRSYQSTLLDKRGEVAQQAQRALANMPQVFPQTGTVACQGVEGAYSQIAADRMFPRGNLVYFKSFEAVFDAVESGLCHYGVLPIENSSNGSVRAVYNLLQKKHVCIVRSERLFVSHELIAKPGVTFDQITEIRSYEQALGQCSAFIDSLGDKVKIVRCQNTAEAAREASESDDRGVAAISSRYCAELYGLEALPVHIQNSENNYTRFICIVKDPMVFPGANRISLILTCKHEPGSLYQILGTFAARGVNLLKLESYPIPGQDFEFMFFFDIEASIVEPGVIEMLTDIEANTESLVFLGNYSEI